MGLSWIRLCLLSGIESVHGSQRDLVGAGVSQKVLQDPWERRGFGVGSG